MSDIRELIEYYSAQGAPADQQMIIALLREAQEVCGGVLSQAALEAIAQGLGMKMSALQALIRRIPNLRCEGAAHCLQICGTCRAGAKLRDYVEKTYGVKSGVVSAAGFVYRVTPCMKNCKNGPSIRWDGVLHSHADDRLIDRLIRGKA